MHAHRHIRKQSGESRDRSFLIQQLVRFVKGKLGPELLLNQVHVQAAVICDPIYVDKLFSLIG